MGTGVEVQSITQQTDTFLENQLRNANSSQAGADTLKGTYTQLENIVGALDDGSDLGSAMNQFFNSIAAVMNQPDSQSVRQSAVLQGQSLAQSINNMASQTVQLRSSLDGQISGMASQINGLTSQIASLNTQISAVTDGGKSSSDANGTDRPAEPGRIRPLATLVGIQVIPQADGTVSIFNGGNYLVNGGLSQQVDVDQLNQSGNHDLHAPVAGNQRPPASRFRPIGGTDRLPRRRARRLPRPVEFLRRHADQRVQQDLFRRARDLGLHADDEP